MRKIQTAIIIAIILSACTAEPDNSPESYLLSNAKINYVIWQDWAARELATNPTPYTTTGEIDLQSCEDISILTHFNIRQYKPNLLHWQTSAETQALSTGVCIDKAILIYMQTRAVYAPDHNIAIIIFLDGSHEGHAACCLIDQSGYRALTSTGLYPYNTPPMPNLSPFFVFNLWGFAFYI